jgi:hypothetical protein
MKIDWRIVLRDALGVLLLGFLGGLIGGAFDGDSGRGVQTTLAIVTMTAGFCVSGCLAKQARFKHLALVAVGVWLIGTIVGLFSGEGRSLVLSLSDLGLIAAAMLLGGLISLAIVKPPPSKPPPAPPPPSASPPA